MRIEISDTKIDYMTIREARDKQGLRIVLGDFAIPGPWHESCKGICRVKGLEYIPVRSSNEGESDAMLGMNGSQSELVEWTAQSSAPVMIWNDERPRSLWNDQLFLAERLAPEPSLIPEDPSDRNTMFGLANELMGENGLIYSKRHLMTAGPLNSLPENSEERVFWNYLGDKYGYSEERAARAANRIKGVLEVIGAQLASQKSAGLDYLVGTKLSALDIYWAAACGILSPLPEDKCPMATDMRGTAYGNDNAEIASVLTGDLVRHRDFIYERHLELPLVF